MTAWVLGWYRILLAFHELPYNLDSIALPKLDGF